MLSFCTVEPHTLELLKALMQVELFSELRLVGGTSLALQYGHRNSVDLDFFGLAELEGMEVREMLNRLGHTTVIKESRNIKIYTIDGIKIDFVNYAYPWIENLIVEDGIRLASDKDIAAMKVNAIEGRGSKKDFIDIYFLLQHYNLQEIFDFYCHKYPENSIFRALLSLAYFDDADPQLMPKMYVDVGWEDMKSFISEQVKHYSRELR